MLEVELLAPAKNLEQGMMAINYGADAVYIGAQRFGARAAAANSLEDISALVLYAHKYRAKVYVTINTILYDDELKEVEVLIHELYNVGVDALIIQDMGILKMNLPPIAIHASTQTNNYTPERIAFLDALGIDRIVLARELSLQEIHQVRNSTRAELEFFVHGALCVSLSGQCFFSQAITGRSANRGMCSQMCRHPYNLLDEDGNVLVSNSHLLSLKDLNLTQELAALLEAGICSLKIEGRLKDAYYVKNVVSHYRKTLDKLFSCSSKYRKASSGNTSINFVPDPHRSFNRQSSDYFIHERSQGLINPYSPKSMGKEIGVVEKVFKDFILVKGSEDLHNGDGLCFVSDCELLGVRVEKVEGRKVFLNDTTRLSPLTVLFRNNDHEFKKQLDADQSIRKVEVSIVVKELDNRLEFELLDEDGVRSVLVLEELPELAKNAEVANKNLITQLSKSGQTMFQVARVDNNCKKAYFFPLSSLNELRRELFEKHEAKRIETFVRVDRERGFEHVKYPHKEVDFSENISNEKAVQFYTECGVEKSEKALEIVGLSKQQLLMTTRYCIKFELGYCERFQGAKKAPKAPLYLEDQHRKYRLSFDCKRCLMQISME